MTVESDIAWDIDYGCYTDVGRVRKRNEDAAKVSPDIFLYAVADGMGGHRAGDRASRIAVQTLHDYLAETEGPADAASEDTVRAAFLAANRNIIEDASNGRPDRLGMGTTLTALILVKDGGYSDRARRRLAGSAGPRWTASSRSPTITRSSPPRFAKAV